MTFFDLDRPAAAVCSNDLIHRWKDPGPARLTEWVGQSRSYHHLEFGALDSS